MKSYCNVLMKALFRPWIVEKDVRRFNVRCEEMKFSAQSYIFEPVYDYADTPTDYTNCGQD